MNDGRCSYDGPSPDEIAFVWFEAHGVQLRGETIPDDAKVAMPGAAEGESSTCSSSIVPASAAP